MFVGHAQAMPWLLHHPGHHLHHCCHQARTKHQGNLPHFIFTFLLQYFPAFVVLEERRANLTEATSAKSATKALLTAFFTRKNVESLSFLLKIFVLCRSLLIKTHITELDHQHQCSFLNNHHKPIKGP